MVDLIVNGHVHWMWCLAAFGVGWTLGFFAFVLASAAMSDHDYPELDHDYPELKDGELYVGPDIPAHWKSKTNREGK